MYTILYVHIYCSPVAHTAALLSNVFWLFFYARLFTAFLNFNLLQNWSVDIVCASLGQNVARLLMQRSQLSWGSFFYIARRDFVLYGRNNILFILQGGKKTIGKGARSAARSKRFCPYRSYSYTKWFENCHTECLQLIPSWNNFSNFATFFGRV